MEKIIKSLIPELEKFQAKAKTLLEDFPGVSENFDIQLEKSLNFLRFKVGTAGATSGVLPELAKITTLRGEKFVQGEKVVEDLTPKENKLAVAASVKTADEIAAEELKAAVDQLEPLFMEIDNAKLVDEQADLVLRGIAKRAGLPVSEDNPKKIDTKYIATIKEAIKKKAELQ
jgi:hypothetical protein